MTDIHSCSYYCDKPQCIKAQRDELRERLAQPEQEPVAWESFFTRYCPWLAQPEQEPVAWVAPSWLNPETRTWENESFAPRPINGWIPLYTAPRQWQGLTDEEIWELAAHCLDSVAGRMQFARAIEAKLKEKNT